MSPETPADLKTVVLAALTKVAPEADAGTIDPKRPLREQLDLDSMDFLNFVVALHDALGVTVPERDYARLATLDSCLAYLAEHRHP